MKETKILEFKQDISNSFLKTVSAYSNYLGGDIIFGINDNGEIIGIDNITDVCLKIENKINELIKPNPNYILSINNKNKTITLKIEGGFQKPYFYNSKAYKRNDTSTIEVDSIELRRLVLEGENKNFEQLPSKKESLQFTYFEKIFKQTKNIEEVNIAILKTLDLFDDKICYNIAAELMSDNNSFPGIDIVKFGSDISTIMDREIINNCSILKMYNNALEMFERYYVFEKIEGFERIEKNIIPKEAFREALANAIVHRTWDVNANIQISMYDDKIEIVSPGGLVNEVDQQYYLNGMISILRNPIIGNVFYRLNYIEQFGTGIRRILKEYNGLNTIPDFTLKSNIVKVVLPKIGEELKLTIDEKIIYELLSNKCMSSSEIISEVEFGKTKVVSILNKLIEKKYINCSGNARGKKYFKV